MEAGTPQTHFGTTYAHQDITIAHTVACRSICGSSIEAGSHIGGKRANHDPVQALDLSAARCMSESHQDRLSLRQDVACQVRQH
jgi:hypothetical protein